MSEASGFAVVEKGRVIIPTVAATPIEAMENWLDGRMPMPSGASEGQIRRAFSQSAELAGAELIPVVILSAERDVRRFESQPQVEEGEY